MATRLLSDLRHFTRRLVAAVALPLLTAPAALAGTPPAWAWARTANASTGTVQVYAADVDAGGAQYITGSYTGGLTLGSFALPAASATDEAFFVAKYNAAGTCVWARGIANTGTERGTALTVGKDGLVYVGGQFSSATFDGLVNAGVGTSDLFVLVLDAGAGATVNALRGGGTNSEFVSDIALSTSSNNYSTFALVGSYYGTPTFNQFNGGSTTLTNAGGLDGFVATGNPGQGYWNAVQRMGGTGDDVVSTVTYFPTMAAMAIAGTFKSPSLTIGSTTLTNADTQAPISEDIFVARLFDATPLSVSYPVRIGGGEADIATDFASSSATANGINQVILTGYFSSPSLAFGATAIGNNTGSTEAFVAALKADMNLTAWQWAAGSGGTVPLTTSAIVAGKSGSLYLGGRQNGSAVLGGNTLAAGGGAFVAKLNNAGAWQWATGQTAGNSSNAFRAVSADSSGNIYAAGTLAGTSVTIGTTINNPNTGGSTSPLLARLGTTVPPTPPTISSVTPASTLADTDLTLAGSGFTNVKAVRIGLFGFITYTVVSSTQIKLHVPPTVTPGTHRVIVTTAGGSASTGLVVNVPPNDLCANATPLTLGTSFIANPINATAVGDPTFVGSSAGVFYSFTGTGGTVRFHLSPVYNIYQPTVSMAVVRGSCGALSLVAEGGDNWSTGELDLSFNSVSGVSYWLFVGGNGTADITSETSPAPLAWNWGKTNTNSGDIAPTASAVDVAGNQYITGFFSGSVTLGATTLTAVGNSDVFIAKYSKTGSVLWAKALGGTANDFGSGIALDNNGYVVVSGSFSSPTFGTLANAGQSDVFVLKLLCSNGTTSAMVRAGSASYDNASAITTDGASYYVTGAAQGAATFGSFSMGSSYARQGFVAKLDAALNWTRLTAIQEEPSMMLGNYSSGGSAIVADQTGNVYVAGQFYGSIVVRDTAYAPSDAEGAQLFIAKMNTAGVWQWGRFGLSYSEANPTGLALDASNYLALAVTFKGNVNFGGSNSFVPAPKPGSVQQFTEGLVLRLTNTGTIQWGRTVGGYDHDEATAVATDAANNIYLAGTFSTGATINGAPFPDFIGAYVAKFSSTGTLSWANNALPHPYYMPTLTGVGVDAGGNVFVAGSFRGDTLHLNNDFILAAANPNATSLLLGRLGPWGVPTPTITSFSPTSTLPGASVTLYGTNLKGTTAVRFYNNVSATIKTVGATSVQVVVPNGAATGLVTLTSPLGTATSPANFTVLVPAPTSTTSASRCGPGSVTLVAYGAPSGGTYRWYPALTGGTAIGTGASFTTPSLTATTTYYVSAVGSTGTESNSRKMATATINPLPTAPSATGASRCGPGSVVLTAGGAPTSATYRWYATATGGTALSTTASYTTPSLTATTTYYVATRTTAGCESDTRTAVTATIIALPSAPSVTGADRCGAGTVTLHASGAPPLGTYRWYAATTGTTVLATGPDYTTPSLTTTKTYYVAMVNAFGCESSPRTAVTATINPAPAMPSASASPSSILIGNSTTLTVSSPVAGLTYIWSGPGLSALSGTSVTATPTNAGPTTYTVTAVSAIGCPSAARTLTVTVNAPPSLQSFAPTSGQVGSSVTLKGHYFTGTTAVKLGSLVASYTVQSDSVISMTVPPAAVDGLISVTSRWGSGSNRMTFIVLQARATVAAPQPVIGLPEVMALAPNPARESVRVWCGAAAKPRTLWVLDATGRRVQEQTLPANAPETTLPLHGLSPGVYFVHLSGAESAPQMQRMVVE